MHFKREIGLQNISFRLQNGIIKFKAGFLGYKLEVRVTIHPLIAPASSKL